MQLTSALKYPETLLIEVRSQFFQPIRFHDGKVLDVLLIRRDQITE